MSKITKATNQQRLEYQGIYPLHGFVQVDGHQCAVEDLRVWSKPDPQWEVLAPEGHRFDFNDLHSLLAFTQADLFERLDGERIKKCEPDCDCREEG